MTSISRYNKPTIVLFAFLPLEAAFYKFSTSWPEVESRTQGSRPRPRIALPRTDLLEAKDRNARGEGPRTQAQVFSKKKGLHKFFRRSPKTRSPKIFSGDLQNFSNSKNTALFSSRGQGNFRGLEASRPRTSKCVLEDSTYVYGSSLLTLMLDFLQIFFNQCVIIRPIST